MKVLGISSAGQMVSFGLLEEEKILAECSLLNIQAEKILFYVKEAGVDPRQIEGIAVTAGPGSYSGLRCGAAAAKTLAQVLNAPLVGISTLEAIAYNLIDREGLVAVTLPSRREEYNFALFGAAGGKLKRLTNDLVLGFDRIKKTLGQIEGKVIVVGADNEPHSFPYGINVAKIGMECFRAEKKSDYLTLIPSYSHEPNLR